MSEVYRRLGEALPPGGAAELPFAPDAKRASAWIDDLPRADLAATRRALLRALEALSSSTALKGGTRREIAEANLAEMREAELEGRLIRVEVIRAAWAKRVASTRDALLQIPSRLAPTVAAQSDVDQVARVLEEELRQALAELSRDGVPVQEVA